MSDSVSKEHALTAFVKQHGAAVQRDDNAGVKVVLKPYLSHINVRVNADDAASVQAIESALSMTLPSVGMVQREAHAIYWLGPDEFLVISSKSESTDLLNTIRHSLNGRRAAATDLSGGQLLMNISGESRRDFLAKASTLDLHPSTFGSNQCAQSTFAKAAALYACSADNQSMELVVRRSFIDYAAQWMLYAGQEFGISFSE